VGDEGRQLLADAASSEFCSSEGGSAAPLQWLAKSVRVWNRGKAHRRRGSDAGSLPLSRSPAPLPHRADRRISAASRLNRDAALIRPRQEFYGILFGTGYDGGYREWQLRRLCPRERRAPGLLGWPWLLRLRLSGVADACPTVSTTTSKT
jgi:hypothetical protein